MVIEKLDNKGRGICYFNNKITFVQNALVSEDVEIEITKDKSKYNEAKVTKYNKFSSDRVEVKCPYYSSCGGCDLLHLNYEKELEFKKQKVEDILKKYGNIDFKIKNIIDTKECNYRNKATFQVKESIGYFKKQSYDIVPIDDCLIVDERINEILKQVKLLDLKNINQLIVRVGISEGMLIIKSRGSIDSRFKDLEVENIINNNKILKGSGYIIEKLGDLNFIISPDSFFQVNTQGAYKLYNQVLKYADLKGSEKVLDLFCGTGTIGLFLSRYSKEVLGVEINESSINDAIRNKKLNHVENIDFICDDVKNVKEKDFDLVVVDPPRSGLDKKTIDYLSVLKSQKIIYVSCDPITLARDLKLLSSTYDLIDVTLVNMFPKTEHVEGVCLLKIK